MELNSPFLITKNEIEINKLTMDSYLRGDLRQKYQTRSLVVEKGENFSIVELGRTKVSCRVITRQRVPEEDYRNRGYFDINIQSFYEVKRDLKLETLTIIRDIIRKNKSIDVDALVIKVGELVWEISCEVFIIDYDGGIYEAVTIAVMCALIATRIPGPVGPRPLVINNLPIPVTFGIFSKSFMVADPDLGESESISGFITITCDASGMVFSIKKSGGISLSSETIVSLINVSLDITKSWHKYILNVFGDDAPVFLRQLLDGSANKDVISTDVAAEAQDVASKDVAGENMTVEEEEEKPDVEALISIASMDFM